MTTETKPKPILFSTDMVQAILDGRKTMTRRVIKPQPEGYFDASYFAERAYNGDIIREAVPRYQPCDILWVREKYGYLPIPDFDTPKLYYAADENPELSGLKIQWCPPLFMPRIAARLFLRVTSVGAERLQEISEPDVIKEGFRDDYNIDTDLVKSAGFLFKAKWDSLNAKRGYGWSSNPWVWVYTFEVTDQKG